MLRVVGTKYPLIIYDHISDIKAAKKVKWLLFRQFLVIIGNNDFSRTFLSLRLRVYWDYWRNILISVKSFNSIPLVFVKTQWRAKCVLSLLRLGLLRVVFSGGGQFDPLFILQEKLLILMCHCLTLLNNLFKVGWM